MTNTVKITVGINFLFLFISIALAVIFFVKIKSLDRSLDKERLKSEMILCEKLGLDKQILSYKKNLDLLKAKNATLEDLYNAANMKLIIQDKELRTLMHKKN